MIKLYEVYLIFDIKLYNSYKCEINNLYFCTIKLYKIIY